MAYLTSVQFGVYCQPDIAPEPEQLDTGNTFFFFFFFCLFAFSRAAPMAQGGSQARGPIGAIATGLHHSHSNRDPTRICNLYHSSWQCRILNTLSEARNQTHVLMDTSWICYY